MTLKNPAAPPATPTPVSALPATNMAELVAAAQRIEPPRKMKFDNMKSRFVGKIVYILPKANCRDELHSRYAVKYLMDDNQRMPRIRYH